jgi:hypothetical protein
MWRAALRDRALFRNDDTFGTLTMYYFSLNYHAVQEDLLCDFHVKDAVSPTPALSFRPQGRLARTRYSTVGKRRLGKDAAIEASVRRRFEALTSRRATEMQGSRRTRRERPRFFQARRCLADYNF